MEIRPGGLAIISIISISSSESDSIVLQKAKQLPLFK